MQLSKYNLESNAKLLKTKVSRLAIYGLIIGMIAVVSATFLVAFTTNGKITLEGIVDAQTGNVAIWILNSTPFLFTIWGQYVSSVITYEAGAMIVDQTHELQMQTSALESKVIHEAMHDPLTELPNRILFLDRLVQALTTARTDKKGLGVFIIDLNNFKEVNDTLGHYNGDRLLKQIAVRLSSVVQEPNTFARLGGDEFAILMPQIAEAKDTIIEARKIQKAFETSFALDGVTLDVRAAIGISLYPEHGSDADTLIQRADVAMYASKYENSPYTVYSPKLDKNSPHKLILIGELRLAIENNKLLLYFQPRVDMKTGQIIGAEALVHWAHEQFGIMAPDDFIPLAERTGLIRPLTQWVINQSLKQCSDWHKNGLKMGVSVNLSTVDVMDVEFPDTIAGLLAANDIEAKWLKLELTESAFMQDQKRCLENLTRLNEMGVELAIDDFGTGYSSLSYLSKLPVNEVKIDKSFVMAMRKNKQDAVIVRATIDLGHNLNLKVAAEGVMDTEIYNDLNLLGCDIAQGYYISKSKSEKEFVEWLNNPKFVKMNNTQRLFIHSME